MVSINVLVVYTNNYISYFFAFKFRKVCHGNDLLAPWSKAQPARSVKSLVLTGRRSNKFSEQTTGSVTIGNYAPSPRNCQP